MQRFSVRHPGPQCLCARPRHLFLAIIILLLCGSLRTVQAQTTTEAANPNAGISKGAQASDNAQPLLFGPAVDRELADGEAHRYRVSLAAGQLLRVAIASCGIDVIISLSDASDRVIVRRNSWRSGATPISAIINLAGVYQLEVRAQRAGEAGTYSIKLLELRDATVADKSRVAAEQAFAAAEQLWAEWKKESLLEAGNKYEEARRNWHTLGDTVGEANAQRSIGEVYQLLGENQQALEHYNYSLLLSRTVVDRRGEIEALNKVGSMQSYVGQSHEALDTLQQALKLSQSAGDRAGEAQSLTNLSEYYYTYGDVKKAFALVDEALPLWRALKDRRGQAQALRVLGYGHTDLSELPQAVEAYEQSITFWRAAGDLREQAYTTNALGVIRFMAGERQSALNLHNEAAQIFHALGDLNGEAVALNGKGEVFASLGDNQKALACYSRSLGIARARGDREGELVALGQVGRLYVILGEYQQAFSSYAQALTLSRLVADRRMEAYWLRDLGDLYRAQGEQAKALGYYQQALLITRELGDLRGEANALNSIGRLHATAGEKQQALDYYAQSLTRYRTAEDLGGTVVTLHDTARLEVDMGRLAEARKHIETALSLAETLRTKVLSHDLRMSFFTTVKDGYELYIDLLMQLHKQQPAAQLDAAALRVSEQSRARSLLELLREAHADIEKDISPALLERKRDLQRLLNEKAESQAQLLSSKSTSAQVAAIKKELNDLLTQYEDLEVQIKAVSPHYASIAQPQPLSLAEIQAQALDDDSILLEYALGDKRSYLWVVTPRSIESFTLPPRAEIKQAVARFYGLLSARPSQQQNEQYAQAARRLSDMLLSPAGALLQQKRLLIVSDGPLQLVPFAALPAPAADAVKTKPLNPNSVSEDVPLIVAHEIVNLPSASVLALLRQEVGARAPAPKTLAVLADPVFDRDDARVVGNGGRYVAQGQRLSHPRGGTLSPQRRAHQLSAQRAPLMPNAYAELLNSARQAGLTRNGESLTPLFYSRQEALGIFALVPDKENLLALDFHANRATVTDRALAQYRIVHFATHAILNDEQPELSGLVLSLVDEQGGQQDGFLRLNEIYDLRLPADLIVLSACQTGLGKEIKGEGLVGLTRGFMYAGAKSVLASLWEIDDKATAELMVEFYQRMLVQGLKPPAALRAAQLHMWAQQNRKQRLPYYWAAFILQGEWK